MKISITITQRNCRLPHGDGETGFIEPELLEWWETEGQHSDFLRAVMVDCSTEEHCHAAVESPQFMRDDATARNAAFAGMVALMSQSLIHRFTKP